MKELAKALLVAMQEIGYLQKDKQVGEGKSAYKALSDNKATQAIRAALIKGGIVALPTDILLTDKCQVLNWQETNQYGNASTKTYVFTEVLMTFTLIHAESGESISVKSLGHGIDSGDKSAGKAMTYAKKNALLNALLVSSGLDADDTHSDDLPTPPPTYEKELTRLGGKHSHVAKVYAEALGVELPKLESAEQAEKVARELFAKHYGLST